MNCKQGTDIIVRQITDLLGRLDADTYSRPLQLFNGSSIGQHFRHILDFYGCLSRGVDEGRVDYARRERDLLVETEPAYAAGIFEQCLQRIMDMDEAGEVEILADFSSELNEERPLLRSTVGRELMYAYDHAVHHLAIIKMGLKVAFPSVKTDQSLGVAPSTLKHWKESGHHHG
jgi:hypothetical protein